MPVATILLVDDEFLITEMMTDALADGGYEVVVANDGAEALAIIDDDAVTIEALVTDVNMGAGADGWSVARRARRQQPNLPVVYTTGGAAHEWAAHGVAASILVVKPFPVSQVLDALHGLLSVR